MSPLTHYELLQILELLRNSEFSEFKFRSGDIELEARRMPSTSAPTARFVAAENSAELPPSVAVTAPPGPPARQADSVTPPSLVAAPRSESAILVTAPMVGTFYGAPEPGAAPFVRVGQRVEHTTTLCIIEVMKLMNTICAGCEGVVTEVLASDGQAVEHGQLLMVIEPSQPNAA